MAPVDKGPPAQPNNKLMNYIKPDEVRQKVQADNRPSDKSVLPLGNDVRNKKTRADSSIRLQAQKKNVVKKGMWVAAIGIDHVSEGSDFDETERLSDVQQAKCQIEAEEFLVKCGRAISSPSKPIEKEPAIEALKLNGFLSNHRGSGKQTEKIEKSDRVLRVVEFPSINKFQK